MQADSDNYQANRESCWFCEETPAHSESAAIVEMHEGGFVGKSHEYLVRDKTTLSVPRCERCKAAHDRVEGHVAKGAIIGLALGLIAALSLQYFNLGLDSIKDWLESPKDELRNLLIVVGLFGMAGGMVSWVIDRALIPKGVKDQRYREQHPSVQQKIREGWKVGPKPPGL